MAFKNCSTFREFLMMATFSISLIHFFETMHTQAFSTVFSILFETFETLWRACFFMTTDANAINDTNRCLKTTKVDNDDNDAEKALSNSLKYFIRLIDDKNESWSTTTLMRRIETRFKTDSSEDDREIDFFLFNH